MTRRATQAVLDVAAGGVVTDLVNVQVLDARAAGERSGR
jgi:hypothetical protein